MSSQQSQRLVQAVQHFQERTRGEELPKETQDAIKGLLNALEGGTPARDTPGGRAALKAAPGTDGTGEPMERAVKGPDGPSPGQRAARSVSQEVKEAVANIAANQASN
jgi:hypothetical protein